MCPALCKSIGFGQHGSCPCCAVGSAPGDRATLSEPMGSSMLFAGEAAHVQYPSTVHGALLSGTEQAARIVRALAVPDDQVDQTCSNECSGGGGTNHPSA